MEKGCARLETVSRSLLFIGQEQDGQLISADAGSQARLCLQQVQQGLGIDGRDSRKDVLVDIE